MRLARAFLIILFLHAFAMTDTSLSESLRRQRERASELLTRIQRQTNETNTLTGKLREQASALKLETKTLEKQNTKLLDAIDKFKLPKIKSYCINMNGRAYVGTASYRQYWESLFYSKSLSLEFLDDLNQVYDLIQKEVKKTSLDFDRLLATSSGRDGAFLLQQQADDFKRKMIANKAEALSLYAKSTASKQDKKRALEISKGKGFPERKEPSKFVAEFPRVVFETNLDILKQEFDFIQLLKPGLHDTVRQQYVTLKTFDDRPGDQTHELANWDYQLQVKSEQIYWYGQVFVLDRIPPGMNFDKEKKELQEFYSKLETLRIQVRKRLIENIARTRRISVESIEQDIADAERTNKLVWFSVDPAVDFLLMELMSETLAEIQDRLDSKQYTYKDLVRFRDIVYDTREEANRVIFDRLPVGDDRIERIENYHVYIDRVIDVQAQKIADAFKTLLPGAIEDAAIAVSLAEQAALEAVPRAFDDKRSKETKVERMTRDQVTPALDNFKRFFDAEIESIKFPGKEDPASYTTTTVNKYLAAIDQAFTTAGSKADGWILAKLPLDMDTDKVKRSLDDFFATRRKVIERVKRALEEYVLVKSREDDDSVVVELARQDALAALQGT